MFESQVESSKVLNLLYDDVTQLSRDRKFGRCYGQTIRV